MNAAITARKCIREALIDFCEQRRYAMLHASAVADHGRVIIVVGDKGSGKTTLALKAVLGHQMRYLSNDHLIVYGETRSENSGSTDLVLTSLPTPIPIKIGTYLDLEGQLPPSWDDEGLDIDAYRSMQRTDLYGLDRRVLYTYRGLGQVNPQTVELADTVKPAVYVVLARYIAADVGEPETVADPMAALMPHVRHDWMFDPILNQRYLPRDERDPVQYLRDAHQVLTTLVHRAPVIRWDHHGDPALLLASLPGSDGCQR